jgi:hypothetical protein
MYYKTAGYKGAMVFECISFDGIQSRLFPNCEQQPKPRLLTDGGKSMCRVVHGAVN